MARMIFHADLDAFFASVEQVDKAEYKGKPVVVGAQPGKRGVVAACSYEARGFGIHSAMPISRASRLCPHAIFLPVRMDRYREVSALVMSIFGDFTPDVRRISIDEAFLDVTGTERLFGSPEDTARKLKARVRAETGLTVSIGAAGNRYIAKIASAHSKPDGLLVVAAGVEEYFLEKLPLRAMWGIGGKTLERLSELGLDSVTRIRSVPEKTLQSMLGVSCGNFLFNAVRGVDPGIFPDETRSRSISSETTFEQDVSDSEILESTILGMAQELMFRLLEEGFRSKTIHLKLRYDDFETLSAQETLSRWIISTDDINAAVLGLLARKRDRKRPIRLIGVGLGNLECDSGIVQNELFEGSSERSSRVERAVLELRKKKGALVTRARLVAAPSKPDKK